MRYKTQNIKQKFLSLGRPWGEKFHISNFKFQENKGFAAFYVTMLVLSVMFVLGISISILTYNEQKIMQSVVKSSQAYYVAEAGVEDALLRLANAMNWSSPYNLNIGAGSAQVEISNILGGSRSVISGGQVSSRTRKVRVVYALSTQEVSFYYGAQVGEGGMEMGNNSRVKGNIYSNGSVIAATGQGFIDDTVVVATNGNRIEGLTVGKDAKAHHCKNSAIQGTLTYVTGGSLLNCTCGGTLAQNDPIPPKDLPISQSQIDGWKQEAEVGGVILGDYTIPGGSEESLGPVKIEGDFLVDNNATLNITGTVWVTGNLRINNGGIIKLDLNSYGPLSGLMIIDGKVKVRPGAILQGTGESGSYLMLLSTNPEILDTVNPAIEIDNNADAAIFYTNEGLIVLRNNVQAREVTGYKVFLENNAEIMYESGLRDTSFSSGPGGTWEVASWKEIE